MSSRALLSILSVIQSYIQTATQLRYARGRPCMHFTALRDFALQWRRPQAVPPNAPTPLDGFTVRRTGDSPTKVRVMMYLEHYPDNFKVQPALGTLLDIKEESRLGIVTALWNYIKINNLQDKVDRRIIRLDDKLKMVRFSPSLCLSNASSFLCPRFSSPRPSLSSSCPNLSTTSSLHRTLSSSTITSSPMNLHRPLPKHTM